jgi:phospholipase C
MCNKEKFWRRLCERIDRPDLAADPRFLTFRERLVHRDELTATLDTALAARTTEEWMAHFAGSVPAAPVRDVADALDSPFVASRAMLLDVPRDASGAGGTAYRTIAGPIRFSDSTPPNRPAPALGADTDAVLAELGYDADRIAALRRAGAIGVEPSVSEPRGGNEMARKQRKRPAEGRAKGTRRTIKPKPTTRTRAAIGDKRTIVTDPFSHVVVLMLENRSFDHVLGTLQGVIPTLDGVPPGASPRSNASADGKLVRQLPVATMRVEPDPRHGHESVLAQIAGDNAGFVRDYATHPDKPSPAQWQQVMACHPRGALPAIHALAEAGAICDRWFCSVPGPTWTNRLFAMSGTSQGRVEMPSGPFNLNIHRYDQPSVFRRIEEVGRRCRIFYGDFPLSLLLADRRSLRGARSLTRFENFAAAARDAESFPDLAWIEPNYLGPWANDDHPPHDSAAAQALIAEVYRALRANEALFRSTLLVITYDEHGGFYDHVKPPRAIPPDAHDEEFAFDRLGVRVPAVLVSPWLAHQVVNTEMDHCALLRALQKRWGLGDMGARVAAAPDLFGLLKLLDKPRSDMPALAAPRVLKKTVTRAIAPPPPADGLESSIMAFGEWLETRTPTKARGARIRTRGTDPAALASARVANFLDARARSRAPARRTGRRTP